MLSTGRSHRGLAVVLWLAAMVMMVGITPRTVEIVGLWRQTRRETEQMERELLALRQQERELQEYLHRVQTPPGREAEARRRGWIRKGEEPLRLNP
ncbi:MAG: hypothetical protein NZ556_03610 [Fimbriimonadales bacterium]|nr:hypothetical protein [Fimbriimonadales bacterium]